MSINENNEKEIEKTLVGRALENGVARMERRKGRKSKVLPSNKSVDFINPELSSASPIKTNKDVPNFSFDSRRIATIEDCKHLAEKHNGKCLSEEYVNNNEMLLWECEHGHQFYRPYSDVKVRDKWCSVCESLEKEEKRRKKEKEKRRKIANLKKSPMENFEQAQKLAEKWNGKLLSNLSVFEDKEKTEDEIEIEFSCSEGHTFKKPLSKVFRLKKFCPICYKKAFYKAKSLTWDDANNVAKAFGGELISKEYTGLQDKNLEWRCGRGHTFKTSLARINNGFWCSECFQIDVEERKKQIALEKEKGEDGSEE